MAAIDLTPFGCPCLFYTCDFYTDQAQQRGLKNVALHVEDYADFVQPGKSQVPM